MSAARLLGGFVAGAALAAAGVAAFAKSRAPRAAAERPAPAAAAKAGDPGALDGLRAQVGDAERRLAAEDAIAARLNVPGGRLGAAAAALARAMKSGDVGAAKAARAVAHLLGRLRYEFQLADEELLVAPMRDRMAPDFLAAMGFPLSAGQQAKFDDLLRFEEQSWKERLDARKTETPLERVAAALDLAAREDDWLMGLLTPQQQSTLLAQPVGENTQDNVCMIGRRWVPPGRDCDFRAEGTPARLCELWGAETGLVGGRFEDYAKSYVEQVSSLGPEPLDSAGGAVISWRRRQAALQARVQRAMLADEDFNEEARARIRKWLTADVWREE